LDSVPSIEVDEDLAAKVRAEFAQLVSESTSDEYIPMGDTEIADSEAAWDKHIQEQPAPKRRGRVPYKRNPDGSYELDADGKPIKDYSARPATSSYSSGVRRNPLPAAPLSKREEKQVAARLQSILTGATGIPALYKPCFLMKDEEASAIAEPLASYLIRMEPTSKVAKQILDEYDLVAVVFAIIAYGARVFMDVQKEREASKNVVSEHGLEPIQRRSKRTVSDDGIDSTRSAENNSGTPRYAGEISTPIIQGDGVLPGL
jgi:hypothetical protein